MTDSYVTLPDGRKLAFTDLGDPGGSPVVFFHGAPSSRLSLASEGPGLADRAVRVISPDRPGYGGSSPQRGRAMADWPADVARLADALDIDRFIVAGHSSGAPYAVACAALLPDRVVGAALLAGVTDMSWPGAWEGYFEVEVAMMRMLDEQSVAARCEELFAADGSRFAESSGLDLPGPDRALLSDVRRARAMLRSIAESFRQGVGGYAQDIFLQGRPWPFAPEAITAPVIVAHGELDTIVPVAHSPHTAGLIAGSSLRILSGHGHLTITSELADLCRELTESSG